MRWRSFARYGIEPPAAVLEHLRAAADETPKPGDPAPRPRPDHRSSRRRRRRSRRPRPGRAGAGLTPVILGDAIEGEAREVAKAAGRRSRSRCAATASRRRRPACSSRAARPRSRCAAAGAAAATPSSCWRSPSSCAALPASARLRPIPTASTAARTTPAPSSRPTRWRARRRRGSTPRPCSPTTTPTGSSAALATW